jgi:anti-sigma-K factor RskA
VTFAEGSTAFASTWTATMTDFSESLHRDDAELLAMLREVELADFQLETPPPSLWLSIEAASRAPLASPVAESVVGGSVVVKADAVAARRDNRSRARLVGVAAAVAALVGAGTLLATQRAGDNLVLASAPLSSIGLPGAPEGLVGKAEVVSRDGHRFVRLKEKGVSPKSGEFLELWLIDADVKGMVSLGVVNGSGEYQLPDGLQVSDYPIVDLSTEPYDGKPTHSGASLLRGKLA